MITIVDYIIDQPEPAGTIMGYLHDYLMSTYPHLTCTMKYEIPFYVGHHWICYLNPKKKGGIELCFTRGLELSNADGILKDKGRKQVSGIEIKSIDSAPIKVIKRTFEEAIILDKESPYIHPKNRKK